MSVSESVIKKVTTCKHEWVDHPDSPEYLVCINCGVTQYSGGPEWPSNDPEDDW